MGIRLSFSTNAYVRFSVFEAVERIGAAGFEAVEILADVPHLYAPSVDDALLDDLRRRIISAGLRTSNINANTAVGFYGRPFWEPLFEPSLANPDPTLRKWRIHYTRRCIEMASRLDCLNVSITSGRMVPGIRPEDSLDLLKFSLEELLPFAERHGVRLGVEYEPGLLVECCDELTALIEQMDSECLGANLDLGHSHVLGEDPAEVVSNLGARLFHVHLEDIKARKHYHLIPGQGDLDFRALFDMLESSGYDGYASVELYTCPDRPDHAAAESLTYLEGVMKSGGRTKK